MHLWSYCHSCCFRFSYQKLHGGSSAEDWMCVLSRWAEPPIRAPSQSSPLFWGHRHHSFTVWSHFVSGVGGGPTRREVLWLAQCTCQLLPHLGGVWVRPAHWREAKGWLPVALKSSSMNSTPYTPHKNQHIFRWENTSSASVNTNAFFIEPKCATTKNYFEDIWKEHLKERKRQQYQHGQSLLAEEKKPSTVGFALFQPEVQCHCRKATKGEWVTA